jgi:hypothetical protein
MIVKRFSHSGLVTGPPVTVGCVKLIEMTMKQRYPLRKYLISALCPSAIMEELIRWISHGPCHVDIRYITEFHPESDSFMGTIEELGYPEMNNKTVQKRSGKSSGTSYTVIDDPVDRDRHGKAYILFREQGSYENKKIQ